MTDIRDMKGPRMLHLRTVKGRGYEPAEKDPANWHAPGKFDAARGVREATVETGNHKPKWQDVFGKTLTELAGTNGRIAAITAAMPSGTSVSMMQAAYPERSFDVGISEGHAVTFAGGMAKEGMLPYVAIYSSFLQRSYDHIIHDVAIQGLPVTLCIDRAGLVGEDGVTHHGVYDVAFLRNIPGMTVAAPRDARWLRRLLRVSQLEGRKGAMAIRYPRGSAVIGPDDQAKLPEEGFEMIGRGEKLKDGKDMSILSLGPIATEVSRAIEILEERRIDAAHYDMVFANPLDESILHEVGRKGKPIVTVEDGTVAGGMGSAVLEWMSDHGYSVKLSRVGIPVKFVGHGSPSELYRLCGMDGESIARKAVELTENK